MVDVVTVTEVFLVAALLRYTSTCNWSIPVHALSIICKYEVHYRNLLTSSGAKPPGIWVPSLEQKQYGNSHWAESHFLARSIGVSVIGAGAAIKKKRSK